MMYYTQLFSSSLVQSIGLTIIDTFWQGALVGLGLFILLSFIHVNASTVRYRVSMLALISMFAWAGCSFVNHYQHSVEQATLPTNLSVDYAYTLGPDGILPNGGNEGGIVIVSWLKDYLYRYSHIVTGMWLCGIFFLYIRLAGGLVYVGRLKTKSPEVTDPFWLGQMAVLKERAGVNKAIKLLESAMVGSPMTMGYLRPVIILPVGMLTGLPTAQLESILIHELIHIKKADYLVNILQSLIEIVLFYHPAIWFISRMIQKERENRCDQITIGLIDDPVHYARALTAIEQNSMDIAPRLAMSAHSVKGDLTRRVFRILDVENPKPRKNRVVAAFLVLLLSVVFFSFNPPKKISVVETVETIATETFDPIEIREKPIQPTYAKDTVLSEEKPEKALKASLVDVQGKQRAEEAPRLQPVSKAGTSTAPQGHIDIKLNGIPSDTTEKNLAPLYYVDGEKADQDKVSALQPSMIKSIEVLKGKKAIEKYGVEGENGVVLIQTKHFNSELLKSMKKEARTEINNERKIERVTFFGDEMQVDSGNVKLDGKVKIRVGDKEDSGAKLIMGKANFQDPLVIIDGIVSNLGIYALDSEISPDDIESVTVLRGQSAIAIYGQKAIDGAILITTKKQNAVTGPNVIALQGPEVFPNPSSGSLNIRFKLDRRSKIGIQVYDLNGKLVEKVLRKSLNKGTHNIKWETDNVPAGNYVLHFNIGKQTTTKQILVQQ